MSISISVIILLISIIISIVHSIFKRPPQQQNNIVVQMVMEETEDKNNYDVTTKMINGVIRRTLKHKKTGIIQKSKPIIICSPWKQTEKQERLTNIRNVHFIDYITKFKCSDCNDLFDLNYVDINNAKSIMLKSVLQKCNKCKTDEMYTNAIINELE